MPPLLPSHHPSCNEPRGTQTTTTTGCCRRETERGPYGWRTEELYTNVGVVLSVDMDVIIRPALLAI